MVYDPAKKKRRIRPSSQTVRQQTEQAKAAEIKPKEPKQPSKVSSQLKATLKPLSWLNRHLVPKFLSNAFAELKNITWIGRKQSRQLTTAVILFAIVFGFLVSIIDLGLDKVFKKVFLKE